MTISKNKLRTQLTLDKEIKLVLEKLAKEQNRSFNNLLETIIKEYLLKQP